MDRWEKTLKEGRRNPSFSSTLLDKIYRSTIDEAETKCQEQPGFFFTETMQKKQTNFRNKTTKTVEDQRIHKEKLMEKKVSEKGCLMRELLDETERKPRYDFGFDYVQDHDALCFSSTSFSSDSSYGGFSSSDTESLHKVKTSSSCFAPLRLKPVRTSLNNVQVPSEKPAKRREEKQSTLFQEQRKSHTPKGSHYSSSRENTPRNGESSLKHTASRIYENLKSLKQPLSPGGRIANFLNSILGSDKKYRTTSTPGGGGGEARGGYDAIKVKVKNERKYMSGQVSTCSSASSFSRSCLSKHSPSTRERIRKEEKRTVRFYPVSIIVDEDCKPCGHKSLYESRGYFNSTSDLLRKIRMSQSRKLDEDLNLKPQLLEKSRRVEEMTKGFLKDYHLNQNYRFDMKVHTKSPCFSRDNNRYFDDDEDDDNDSFSSCSSSDLFELDHLSVICKDRYSSELPVYETTCLNDKLCNSLIM